MAEDRVEAVERALSLLEAFSEEEDTLSLAQLAEKTGYYKSTILRLSASLQRFGYLSRPSGGNFRLGPALWRLGLLYRREFGLGETIRPALRRLRDAMGETASFYIGDGNKRVCLYRLNSRRAIRHHLDEGVQLPIEHGAAGHVLMAYSGASGDRYDAVRSHGFAVSMGERDPDIGAVAVPVLNDDGELAGALTLSGLIRHFEDKVFQKKAKARLRAEASVLMDNLRSG